MQLIPKWFADRSHRQIGAILVAGLLVRTLVALWLYPGFDEAYYYLYTYYLNWSYFDHPVLVAFTTGFGIWLTGGAVTQFTIRLGTLLLFTGTLILFYRTADRLFGKSVAFWTLALASTIPFFQIGFGTLTLPDVPLMFFWTAALYFAATEFFRQPGHYQPSYRLAILCGLIGLACLGKYHGFVLGASLVGFCLSQPRYRAVWRSPWLGLGVLLFGLTLLPLVIWNAQHEWISFRFQSMRTVQTYGTFLPLDLLATFLVGVAYLFPPFGFPLWWVTIRTTIAQFRPSTPKPEEDADLPSKQRLILWIALPLMIGFTLMGGYRQVLPSWPMPGFWTATLLLGYQATQWHQRSPKAVQRWLQGSALVLIGLLAIALSHIALGTVQKPSQYAIAPLWPHQQDPSVQLIDVEQLRQGFARSPELMKALQESAFVFSNRFFVTGQIAMALMPLSGTPVTCFDEDLRGFAYWSRRDQWLGKDALYITSELFQEGEDLMARYGPYFRSIQKIGEIPILRGGVPTAMFHIYQARDLQKPYPRPYGI